MKRHGYPTEILVEAFTSVCEIDHATLLRRMDTEILKKGGSDDPPLVGITTFHPSCKTFNRALCENCRSATTNTLFNKKILVAYRRPQNLGDTLI